MRIEVAIKSVFFFTLFVNLMLMYALQYIFQQIINMGLCHYDDLISSVLLAWGADGATICFSAALMERLSPDEY